MKKIVSIFLPTLLLILLVSGILPIKASAHHSWNGYHWGHTRVPFQVKLGDNVSAQWKPFLFGAAYYWDRSSVLDIPVIAGSTSPSSCQMRSGTVQVCNAAYGTTGWLGLAQLTVSGKIITAGTVKLNDTYFNQARFNNATWKNLVACQEIGHSFGLTHQDENFGNAPLGSCMDYSNDPNPNQHPNFHDYQELQSIYLYNDTASDAAVVSDNAVQDFSNKSQWGRLVSGTEPGAIKDASVASTSNHYAVYERDLGAGKKLNTVVFWAQ